MQNDFINKTSTQPGPYSTKKKKQSILCSNFILKRPKKKENEQMVGRDGQTI
jgi:hypothetical protein